MPATRNTPDYYLGLMSGTSVDGIDAALVDLSGERPHLLQAHTFAWPDELQRRILTALDRPGQLSVPELGALDALLGEAFARAALELIETAAVPARDITAIGSHGQTLFHAPDDTPAFTLQAGDANRIAELTGITTVADFRRRDIAAGGQGAPLAPAFHRAIFHHPAQARAVLNLGGMANLTLLPPDAAAVTGFDTGPGNVLLDAWHAKHRGDRYDANGDWARSGTLNQALLEQLLAHPWFSQPPPKSTGRELFCLAWLEQQLQTLPELPPADVQRTLLELTAQSVSQALQQTLPAAGRLLVCGGGAHNGFLLQRLQALLPGCEVESTEHHGLHPDWVEAVAFAWLAKQTLDGKPGNLPAVTGARHEVVLGAVYRGCR